MESVLGVHWKDWCWSRNSNTWPPHAKSWLIGKDPDAGRDWGQEEKGMTEDEMAGWHHRLDAHEFGWNLGVGDGQGGLACCNSWGRKELVMTEQLNWTEISQIFLFFFNIGIYNFKFPSTVLTKYPKFLYAFAFISKYF